MSKSQVFWCGLSLALLLPNFCFAQIFTTAQSLPRGSFSLSASPAVFMDEGVNELAFFAYGGYGLARGLDLHVRAGFFESTNYYGANLEWTTRQSSPFFSISAGAHKVNDPGLDGSLNLTFLYRRGFAWYVGADADLILDDNPDLPAWLVLGVNYNVIDQLDVMMEFDFGIFEIAPHILAAGFVFNF